MARITYKILLFFSGGLPCTIKQEITDSDYEEKYNHDGEGN